jgi:hypothetical protein
MKQTEGQQIAQDNAEYVRREMAFRDELASQRTLGLCRTDDEIDELAESFGLPTTNEDGDALWHA